MTNQKVRGVMPGAKKWVPLLLEPMPTEETKPSVLRALKDQYERFERVCVGLIQLPRKTVRRKQLEVERIQAKYSDLLKQGGREQAAEALDELEQAYLDLMRQRHGGQPALFCVRGITAVTPDGDRDLEDVEDHEELIQYLEEMDLVSAVGAALLRGQNPTAEMGN